jgi:hypothetical protein
MRCSRCGADAVTARDRQNFCGRCALVYDWEEIIAIAQETASPPPAPGRAPTPA